MITVKEAQTKICPFIEPRGRYGNSTEAFAIKCQTNECMAWIYTKTKDIKYIETEDYEEVEVLETYGSYSIYQKELSEEEKEGYCVRLYPQQMS